MMQLNQTPKMKEARYYVYTPGDGDAAGMMNGYTLDEAKALAEKTALETGFERGAQVRRLDNHEIVWGIDADAIKSEITNAAQALGRKGGSANTPAQQAQRSQAKPGAGRPSKIKHVFALKRSYGWHPCAILRNGRVFIEPIHFSDPDSAVEFTEFSRLLFRECSVSWSEFCKLYTADDMDRFPSEYKGA